MTSPAPVSVSIDPVELAQALIRRPSVTPADEGAMDTCSASWKPWASIAAA
jgi:succinyl-diaminopimelate desuccinylase